MKCERVRMRMRVSWMSVPCMFVDVRKYICVSRWSLIGVGVPARTCFAYKRSCCLVVVTEHVHVDSWIRMCACHHCRHVYVYAYVCIPIVVTEHLLTFSQ